MVYSEVSAREQISCKTFSKAMTYACVLLKQFPELNCLWSKANLIHHIKFRPISIKLIPCMFCSSIANTLCYVIFYKRNAPHPGSGKGYVHLKMFENPWIGECKNERQHYASLDAFATDYGANCVQGSGDSWVGVRDSGPTISSWWSTSSTSVWWPCLGYTTLYPSFFLFASPANKTWLWRQFLFKNAHYRIEVAENF